MFGFDFQAVDWPWVQGWLTTGAAVAAALFSWRVMRNDSLRMRRVAPSVELHPTRNATPRVEGWDEYYLVVRNHETVSVTVRGVRIRRWRRGFVVSDHEAASPDGFGGVQYRAPLPEKRVARLDAVIRPAGSSRAHGSRDDSMTVLIFVKNVRSVRDLALDWAWLDGQK